ncbi:MAG: hypothetical protein LUC83_09965 [Clostridiales bacterium]|nr:hypothetical protein [Clostridiales bacterium]
MRKIIKITTDNRVSTHDFPEGSYSEQNEALRGLIGEGCDLYEHVKPPRLYEEMGASRDEASMLVDEKGRMKYLHVNQIASWLYGVDLHGGLIVGDVLIIGEERDISGEIDFCGLSEDQFNKLYPQFKSMAEISGGGADEK